MEQLTLAAEPRALGTKGARNDLRRAGRVPAIVYGHGVEPVTVAVEGKSFDRVMRTAAGGAALVKLELPGGPPRTVIVKAVQRDIISRKPIHVDFQQISMTEKLEVPVPIMVVGEPEGVRTKGGVLDIIVREVRVRCLPTAIPAAFRIDVTALQIGQGVLVKDLEVPAGVEMLTAAAQVVLNVTAPTILEEAPAVAAVGVAPTTAEPEVIKKGKKDEEEGAAPAAGGAKAEVGKPGDKKPAPTAAGKAPAAPEKKKS